MVRLLSSSSINGEGAIDWVLDPANNRVIVTDPTNPATAPAGKVWVTNGLTVTASSTPQGSCNIAYQYYEKPIAVPAGARNIGGAWFCGSTQSAGNGFSVYLKNGTATDGSTGDNKRYIPIDTVAAKVIANAEAGHAPSQEAVKATALEGFAAGEHDAALDAAATETGTENPPDTENPPKDPAAPFDPAGIISAINALKALLAGILSSIGELTGFMNSDLPPEKTQKETDVPIDDLPPTKNASEFDVNYINFGGQCPVLPSFSVGIGGASSALTFDMTPLCDMALKIRPAVIAIAYFIGLGVIASAIRET